MGELAAGLLAGALITLAVLTVVILARRLSGGPTRSWATYLGPDVAHIEDGVLQRLNGARALAPLATDPVLQELARHHAHWMSVAGRCSPVDDQGRDVDGRRRHLFEEYAGPLAQQEQGISCEGLDEQGAADRVVDALGASPWNDERWTHGGVGVSGSPGRLWICVVVGRPDEEPEA